MTSQEQLKEIKTKIDVLEQEKLELSKNLFKETTDQIFKEYPKLLYFCWNQYTPYFNDGDSCEFGVEKDDINIFYDGQDYEEVHHWCFESDSESYVDYQKDPTLKEVYHKIHDLLGVMDDSVLENMFGDHVTVQVYQDKVEIHDYNHN